MSHHALSNIDRHMQCLCTRISKKLEGSNTESPRIARRPRCASAYAIPAIKFTDQHRLQYSKHIVILIEITMHLKLCRLINIVSTWAELENARQERGVFLW